VYEFTSSEACFEGTPFQVPATKTTKVRRMNLFIHFGDNQMVKWAEPYQRNRKSNEKDSCHVWISCGLICLKVELLFLPISSKYLYHIH